MKNLILLTIILWAGVSHAESQFPRQTLKFSNGVTLKVEVATTPEQKTQGLMFRTELPDGHGMLFIFQMEQPLAFWMKNTLIPLSIGYFDKDKKLVEVLEMAPAVGPVREEQLPRYPSSRPVMYALEVPKGWFAKKKIKPSASFSLSK